MARVSFVAACPAAVEVWSAILVFPTRSYCWFPAVVNFPTAGGIPAVAKVSAFAGDPALDVASSCCSTYLIV